MRVGAHMIPDLPLSVVMPVFNGERFVASAIRSILDQTFRDFEFIIVDDGSTDQTSGIVRSYAGRDARIRVVRNDPNLGFGAALNIGCRLARGMFVARMDADDVSAPTRFAAQLDFLKNHPDVAAVG